MRQPNHALFSKTNMMKSHEAFVRNLMIMKYDPLHDVRLCPQRSDIIFAEKNS